MTSVKCQPYKIRDREECRWIVAQTKRAEQPAAALLKLLTSGDMALATSGPRVANRVPVVQFSMKV